MSIVTSAATVEVSVVPKASPRSTTTNSDFKRHFEKAMAEPIARDQRPDAPRDIPRDVRRSVDRASVTEDLRRDDRPTRPTRPPTQPSGRTDRQRRDRPTTEPRPEAHTEAAVAMVAKTPPAVDESVQPTESVDVGGGAQPTVGTGNSTGAAPAAEVASAELIPASLIPASLMPAQNEAPVQTPSTTPAPALPASSLATSDAAALVTDSVQAAALIAATMAVADSDASTPVAGATSSSATEPKAAGAVPTAGPANPNSMASSVIGGAIVPAVAEIASMQSTDTAPTDAAATSGGKAVPAAPAATVGTTATVAATAATTPDAALLVTAVAKKPADAGSDPGRTAGSGGQAADDASAPTTAARDSGPSTTLLYGTASSTSPAGTASTARAGMFAAAGTPLAATPQAKTGTTGPVQLGSIDVDLADEGLGPLRMTALSRAGLLHVSLAAADPVVRGQLIDHAAELRREMASAGVHLGSLDVGSFASGHGGSALADHDDADARAAATRDGNGTSPDHHPDAKAPKQPSSTVSTSRLDLRI